MIEDKTTLLQKSYILRDYKKIKTINKKRINIFIASLRYETYNYVLQ